MNLRRRMEDRELKRGTPLTYDEVLDFHLALREVYGVGKNERDFFARFTPRSQEPKGGTRSYVRRRGDAPSIPSEPTRLVILEDRAPYLIIKGDSFHPLAVSLHKIGYSPEVHLVVKHLGLKLSNTAKELDGTPYIGNVTWDDAIRLNKSLGNVTLSPYYFFKFYKTLDDAAEGRIDVLDETNRPVNQGIFIVARDEIVGPTKDFRGEWLYARFSKKGNLLYINHPIIAPAGKIKETTEPLSSDTLMSNRQISLEEFLSNPTSQGMPRKGSSEGDLYYWAPTDGAVVGLFAVSGGASLDCSWGPRSSNAAFGVRSAKILER